MIHFAKEDILVRPIFSCLEHSQRQFARQIARRRGQRMAMTSATMTQTAATAYATTSHLLRGLSRRVWSPAAHPAKNQKKSLSSLMAVIIPNPT